MRHDDTIGGEPTLPGNDAGPISIGDRETARAAESCGCVDRYDLIKSLGRGGFGSVYLARDREADVYVALKALPVELSGNPDELERVRKNFALVEKLKHPNIASVNYLHRIVSIDSGAVALLSAKPGDYLVVMEVALGVTLNAFRMRFDGGRMPVEACLEICEQVAEALDFAHERRIIHRDVKPSNIMIDDSDGLRVKVLDFGLAAEVRASMTRVSSGGASTSGTRPYMAPEQWAGRHQDAKTDQYALAVLVYELLSGEPPFNSAFEAGDIELMMHLVAEITPDPLRELSKEQNRSLLRALDKRPENRYDTCSTFIHGLDRKRRYSFLKMASGFLLMVVCAALGMFAFRDSLPGNDVPKMEQPKTAQRAQLQDNQDLETALQEVQKQLAGFKERSEKLGLSGFYEQVKTSAEGIAAMLEQPSFDQDAADKKIMYTEQRIGVLETACKRIEKAERLAERAKGYAEKSEAFRFAETLYREAGNHVTMAHSLLEKGNWKGAADALDNATGTYSKSAEFAEAVQLFKQEKAATGKMILKSGGKDALRLGDGWERISGLLEKLETLEREAFWTSDQKRLKEGVKLHQEIRTLLPDTISSAEIETTKQRFVRAVAAGDWGKAIEAAESTDDEKAKTFLSLAKKSKRSDADVLLKWSPHEYEQGVLLREQAIRLFALGNRLDETLSVLKKAVSEFTAAADAASSLQNKQKAEKAFEHLVDNVDIQVKEWRYSRGKREMLMQYSAEIRDIDNLLSKSKFVEAITKIENAAENPRAIADGWMETFYQQHLPADLLFKGSPVLSEAQHEEALASRLPVYVSTRAAGIRMVLIPEGSFQMGVSNRERRYCLENGLKADAFRDETAHEVRFRESIYMGVTEVTREQWKQVTGKSPSFFRSGNGKEPVEMVSFSDVNNFLQALCKLEGVPEGTYRLPTEAEWEYACRAGTTDSRYGNLDAIGWFDSNSGSMTHPVGQRRSNAFGLHDMIGNVYEWCKDTWHTSYKNAPTDGSAWTSGNAARVLHGGSWDSTPQLCRSSSRGWYVPDNRDSDVGFRVVVDAV